MLAQFKRKIRNLEEKNKKQDEWIKCMAKKLIAERQKTADHFRLALQMSTAHVMLMEAHTGCETDDEDTEIEEDSESEEENTASEEMHDSSGSDGEDGSPSDQNSSEDGKEIPKAKRRRK